MAPPVDLSWLSPADAIIIIPAFANVDEPVFGTHVLQACARKAGHSVTIFYANLVLAAMIGEARYLAVDEAPFWDLAGEQAFARLERDPGPPPAGSLEAALSEWADIVASAVVAAGFKVVGCSSSFQQISSCMLLLRRIKRLRPEIVTIVGGANCEGEMAEGMESLGAPIDFVFSGESEASFVSFLAGVSPATRVIAGEPCKDLDGLPLPDYTEFFEQRRRWMPGRSEEEVWLPYESSRGCWWGQKYHCTFCGDPMVETPYREKSPERVIGDLAGLLERNPSTKIHMVDDIMPYSYFRTLIPELSTAFTGPKPRLFYMQKANLTLRKVAALKDAGVLSIQPGIESLSTAVLKRMKKGVTAAQCIALLRYARSVDLEVLWNLLHGFPGDRKEEYEEMLALFPALRHLQPPSGPILIRIDRFSPYYDRPAEYGIADLRPLPSYSRAFPPKVPIEKLAYHFVGDYDCEARGDSEVIAAIGRELDGWRQVWRKKPVPLLLVHALSPSAFALIDTRGLPGSPEHDILDKKQVSAVLGGSRKAMTPEIRWALQRRLVVELDGWYVPLATANADLLTRFGAAVDARQEELAPGFAASELIPSLVKKRAPHP